MNHAPIKQCRRLGAEIAFSQMPHRSTNVGLAEAKQKIASRMRGDLVDNLICPIRSIRSILKDSNIRGTASLRQKASLNLPIGILKPRQISSICWWVLSCHLPKRSPVRLFSLGTTGRRRSLGRPIALQCEATDCTWPSDHFVKRSQF